MERAAELEQAQATAGAVSLAFAQAQGSVLANLRCVDVEGAGLMGRSLVRLVGNKNNGEDPLPPSKISPNGERALDGTQDRVQRFANDVTRSQPRTRTPTAPPLRLSVSSWML